MHWTERKYLDIQKGLILHLQVPMLMPFTFMLVFFLFKDLDEENDRKNIY